MGSLLRIGNLSMSTSNEELAMKLAGHGDVESLTVTRNSQSGSSRQTAIVIMANEVDAQSVIDWLHLSQFDDQTISVTRVLKN